MVWTTDEVRQVIEETRENAKKYYLPVINDYDRKCTILLDAMVKVCDNYNMRTPEEIRQIAAEAIKAVGRTDMFDNVKEEEAAA